MIIRSRRKNESLWRRLLRASLPSKLTPQPSVVSEEDFQLEIAKETSRSNRRAFDREFSIIVFSLPELPQSNPQLASLVNGFRSRMRISDTIGIYHGHLAVLLPETDREGAMLVANDFAKMGLVQDLRFDTDILVYPWDDDIAVPADELSGGEGTQPKLPKLDKETESDKAHCSSLVNLSKSKTNPSSASIACSAFEPALKTPVWKRSIDVFCSGIGLICLSPVLVGAAAAIKLSSPGPVFFKQKREGINGKVFEIWKFRTMRIDAEELKDSLRNISEQDGPAFKLTNDPRVTKVGKYLRKSCVDELPQLINVLIGQMSLVGPRPLPVNESVACRSWQRHRLRVLPGVTCIWQVDGGRDTKFDEWMRMDMDYIRKRSFLFDAKLIFRTAVLAVLHRGSV